MSAFDERNLKQLQAKWYEKLKKKGFKDIETEYGLTPDRPPAHDFAKRMGYRQDLVDDIEGYYEWANKMLHEAAFKTQTDKDVWRLHAEGKTSREIEKVIPLEQTWICRKIKKIRLYLGRGF